MNGIGLKSQVTVMRAGRARQGTVLAVDHDGFHWTSQCGTSVLQNWCFFNERGVAWLLGWGADVEAELAAAHCLAMSL